MKYSKNLELKVSLNSFIKLINLYIFLPFYACIHGKNIAKISESWFYLNNPFGNLMWNCPYQSTNIKRI